MPPKKKTSAAPATAEEDVSMTDASPLPTDVPEPEYNIEVDDHRIRIVSSRNLRFYGIIINCIFQLPGASDTAASFEFKKEDHTLGNALRYIIMKKSVYPAIKMSTTILLSPDLFIIYPIC
jgi:DNA-directed RNA polymerase I and III subunit RPAC2